jgi:hypothetical protein
VKRKEKKRKEKKRKEEKTSDLVYVCFRQVIRSLMMLILMYVVVTKQTNLFCVQGKYIVFLQDFIIMLVTNAFS